MNEGKKVYAALYVIITIIWCVLLRSGEEDDDDNDKEGNVRRYLKDIPSSYLFQIGKKCWEIVFGPSLQLILHTRSLLFHRKYQRFY